MNKKLSLSILSADLANIEYLITSVVASGVQRIHLDIMDGVFVPNLTIGAEICKTIERYSGSAEIDVHLMVQNPDQAISWFKDIADIISIHPEVGGHIDRSIQMIKGYGIKAGFAINPATPLSCLDYILDKLDLVTVMSVNPGFGGQKFITSQLNKIIQLRDIITKNNLHHQVEIQVDGGVNLSNISQVMHAGANSCVVGSAIFAHENYLEKITEFNAIINSIN